MAAWKAAESHARTVLIEREPSPGKKVCAEGVLSDVLTDAEVKPSPEFVANEISGAFLYSPDEAKRVNVGGEGYILDKPAFLRVLAKDRKSTRLNSSHITISYAVFCLKKKQSKGRQGIRIRARPIPHLHSRGDEGARSRKRISDRSGEVRAA